VNKIMTLLMCMVIATAVQAEELTLKMGPTERTGIGRIDCVRRVQITSSGKPDASQLRAVAENAYKITRALNKPKGSTTIFIYIDGMPTDQAAYAIAEGTGETVETFQLNEQQYEFWQMIKNP